MKAVWPVPARQASENISQQAPGAIAGGCIPRCPCAYVCDIHHLGCVSCPCFDVCLEHGANSGCAWQGKAEPRAEPKDAGQRVADKSGSPCRAESEADDTAEGTEKYRTVSMSWRDWSHSDFFH